MEATQLLIVCVIMYKGHDQFSSYGLYFAEYTVTWQHAICKIGSSTLSGGCAPRHAF